MPFKIRLVICGKTRDDTDADYEGKLILLCENKFFLADVYTNAGARDFEMDVYFDYANDWDSTYCPITSYYLSTDGTPEEKQETIPGAPAGFVSVSDTTLTVTPSNNNG